MIFSSNDLLAILVSIIDLIFFEFSLILAVSSHFLSIITQSIISLPGQIIYLELYIMALDHQASRFNASLHQNLISNSGNFSNSIALTYHV
ncbi:MAG: hypothetical protein Q8S84_01405 [bacterium]|nr:hypothetical protein [bacterium]